MRFAFLLALLCATVPALAQQPLTVDDYPQWQQLRTPTLADNGTALVYPIDTFDHDDFLVLHHLGGGQNDTLMHASRPVFSPDAAWLAFHIGVSHAEQDRLDAQEKSPTPTVGLMHLPTAAVDTFVHVIGADFADAGRWLVLRKEKPQNGPARGYDLVLMDLTTRTQRLFGNVAEYAFNEAGTHLALLLDAHEQLGNGVHLLDLASGTTQVLDADRTAYTGLTWHDERNALAFLKEVDSDAYTEPAHHLLAFTDLAAPRASITLDPATANGFPDGFRISDERALTWSDNGATVFFGIKEGTPTDDDKDAKADSTAAEPGPKKDDKPAGVDVWHWNDPLVQPQQKVRAGTDRRFTYLAAWHLDAPEGRFVQIADEQVRQVVLNASQTHAVGYDPAPYQPAFRESWNDVYVIDIQTGAKTRVLERSLLVQPSPGGRYVLYFRGDDWHTYDVATNTHTNLTADLDARFDDYTRVNGREQPQHFGTSFWGTDDAWVLLNDRYDVWRVRPDGAGAERLTNGAADRIRHRVYRAAYDRNQDALTDDDPVYFSLYGDRTKDSGFARLQDGRLTTLVYEPRQLSGLRRADDADLWVYTAETAAASPNLYATDATFRRPARITNTNPQQADYQWAGSELVTFQNASGDTLQGRLLYPADYQPGQQYPMIVYIYELRSQSLHDYTQPSDRRAYNQRRLSAEGFFVFEPDITYRLRDPGVSAVESVVPAVEKVLETGMVNPAQIGLMGHSWGAYQTAFIVSQTDLFNAAVAGAPLTNMISMYGSMYWNSGTPDAVIFETSQGRFPEPYWLDWEKYVANSPVFHAENITTPLLFAFGDKDGAVDFNQGVEMYNAMRRLEKPFVMLVYEGENHGLAKEENQRDYATRTLQWFRHYLLGEPAPGWVDDGQPWLDNPFRNPKK